MCGRFILARAPREIAELFELEELPDFLKPRYNIAPSQLVATVGAKKGGGRGCAQMRWGLVPRWSDSPNSGPRPINAKSESVAEKPPFRECFQLRRCLIPTDGFYEWKQTPEGKRPSLFRTRCGLAAFAALWDVWTAKNTPPLYTFTILTTRANRVVAQVHDRMPVIFTKDVFAKWLDPAAKPAELKELLMPFPESEMEEIHVSTAVNNARRDAPDCVEPI